jgi:hypothetical protein
MISFGIEAEGPILKLFLERSVCAPSICQLELALHPWCLFYSEFHFIVDLYVLV